MHLLSLCPGAHQDGDVRGTHRARRGVLAGGGDPGLIEEVPNAGHQVVVDDPNSRIGLHLRASGRALDPLAEGQAQRKSGKGPVSIVVKPPVLVRRRRFNHDEGDVLVTEGRPFEEGFQGGHHGAVRSPVGNQGSALGAGTLGNRLQIGVDVRASEPVDGLLGVAHQHQGRAGPVLAEQPREDAPLHGIGVLELVDQGHLEAASQGIDHRRRTGALQGGPQLGQQVVEAHGAVAATTFGHLLHRPHHQIPKQPVGRSHP